MTLSTVEVKTVLNIKLENVCKQIKGNSVLDNISIEMESGRIYGFQGINGSGKTMLMRVISGLIRPTSGQVFINKKRLGKDITFPENMGLLIENPAFLDSYSGFENLKILASIKEKISDDIIKNVITKVGLDPNDKKKYRKYSLGMKQRLGIAAALMENPDLIILDEPTNALDSNGVETVKQLIFEYKNSGALIILSCHDFSILEMLSDEIILLERGKIKSINRSIKDEK